MHQLWMIECRTGDNQGKIGHGIDRHVAKITLRSVLARRRRLCSHNDLIILLNKGYSPAPQENQEESHYLFIELTWIRDFGTVCPAILARVAELVDALDLGSSRVTCESSSLSSRIHYIGYERNK